MIQKIISLFRAVSDPATPDVVTDGSFTAPSCDIQGNVWVRVTGETPGGDPGGISVVNVNDGTPIENGFAAFNAGFPFALDLEDLISYRRVHGRILPNNIDGADDPFGRVAASITYGWDFDLNIGQAIRIINASSNFTPTGGGEALETASANYGFNGTDWVQITVTNFATVTDLPSPGEGGLNTAAFSLLYDPGTTLYNIEQSNAGVILLASAIRSASNNSADQTNVNARGVDIILDVTVVPGVDTITLTIEGKDPASGKYYTILAGAAINAVGTNIYRVYPGLTAAANAVANFVLPKVWRVSINHSAATNFTYSVGANLVV